MVAATDDEVRVILDYEGPENYRTVTLRAPTPRAKRKPILGRCKPKLLAGGRRWRCNRCGFEDAVSPITKLDRIYRKCEIPFTPGLGDLLAMALVRCGLTKRGWSRAMVYLRLKSPVSICGCSRRQQRLNRIGDSLLRWWRS